MTNITQQKPDDSQIDECCTAIELGLQALINENIDGGPYKLVEVKNLLKGASPKSDPNVWRLTFKAQCLIPSTADGLIGAGGEVYFEVNLATRQAYLTGRGD